MKIILSLTQNATNLLRGGGRCSKSSKFISDRAAFEAKTKAGKSIVGRYKGSISIKEEDPELWKAINPYSHIERSPELQVSLFHGDDVNVDGWDIAPEVSIEFNQALAEDGYDAKLIVVERADHNDLPSPSSDAFAVTLQQMMEFARSSSQ